MRSSGGDETSSAPRPVVEGNRSALPPRGVEHGQKGTERTVAELPMMLPGREQQPTAR